MEMHLKTSSAPTTNSSRSLDNEQMDARGIDSRQFEVSF